ncbi:MAG: hypothetical protein IJZ19_04870 [Lentisphaeria bacterium]|nr:hypothetical protein [Lentisphaeria bacterium]
MKNFTTSCPHCKAEIQAETDWIGLEAACPTCGKNFRISAPTRSKISKIMSFFDFRKKYFFGRSFVGISWVVALIFLLFSIFTIIMKIQQRANEVRTMENLWNNSNEKRKYIKDIQDLQKSLLDHYSKSVNALTKRQNVQKASVKPFDKSSKKKPLTPEGLTITNDLTHANCYFNEDLISSADIEESISSLKTMKGKIEQLHEIFYHQIIAKFDSNSGTFSVKRKTQGKGLRLGEDDNGYDFYPETPDMKEYITKLQEVLKKNTSDQKIKTAPELEKLKRQLLFLKKYLFRHKGNTINLQGIRSNIDASAEFGKENLWKKELYSVLLRLNEGWNIDISYKLLDKELKLYLERQTEKEEEFEEAWDGCRRDCIYLFFKEFLFALLISFMIVVFADYLKAHFEMAIKICEEK